MNKQEKLNKLYLQVAELYASMSVAERLKVGAIAVKDGRIISVGWNGTPTGWPTNECEHESVTREEVLHAEQNLITKIAKSTESMLGCSVYCTHSPCVTCAKLLAQCGISDLHFKYWYHNFDGVKLLNTLGINTVHHP